MPRLPVEGEAPPDRAAARKARHAKRLRVRRAILAVLVVALSGWLVAAARAPSSGPVEQALLLLIAALLPIHVVFYQLGGTALFNRVPRGLRGPLALVALAASPMVLYPLGLLALVVSLFTDGAATPALGVVGGLMLAPIALIFGLGLFMALAHSLRR